MGCNECYFLTQICGLSFKYVVKFFGEQHWVLLNPSLLPIISMKEGSSFVLFFMLKSLKPW